MLSSELLRIAKEEKGNNPNAININDNVPGCVPSNGDTIQKDKQTPCPNGAYILVEETNKNMCQVVITSTKNKWSKENHWASIWWSQKLTSGHVSYALLNALPTYLKADPGNSFRSAALNSPVESKKGNHIREAMKKREFQDLKVFYLPGGQVTLWSHGSDQLTGQRPRQWVGFPFSFFPDFWVWLRQRPWLYFHRKLASGVILQHFIQWKPWEPESEVSPNWGGGTIYSQKTPILCSFRPSCSALGIQGPMDLKMSFRTTMIFWCSYSQLSSKLSVKTKIDVKICKEKSYTISQPIARMWEADGNDLISATRSLNILYYPKPKSKSVKTFCPSPNCCPSRWEKLSLCQVELRSNPSWHEYWYFSSQSVTCSHPPSFYIHSWITISRKHQGKFGVRVEVLDPGNTLH